MARLAAVGPPQSTKAHDGRGLSGVDRTQPAEDFAGPDLKTDPTGGAMVEVGG